MADPKPPTVQEIAKLKPIDVEPVFVGGFHIQGTGNDFVIYCQRTRALLNEIGDFTPHARRETVAALAVSPQALKDLAILLSLQIAQYEKAYGPVQTDYSRRVASEQKPSQQKP